jgi:hypothetical protein
MSKKGLFSLIILLLLVVATYMFFTIKKTYSNQKIVSSSEECVRRHFINKSLWQKWNFGKKVNDSTFTNNNTNYTITKVLFNGFHLIINNEADSLQAIVQFESAKEPSKSTINFSTIENKNSGLIENYKYSNRLKKFEGAINTFMTSIESFFNSQQKVYGFDVKMERTEDPNLLVYKQQLKQEPTIQEVYKVIDKIDAYIKAKNGAIKSPPMLNVFEESPQVYHVMVALPTTQFLEGNNYI